LVVAHDARRAVVAEQELGDAVEKRPGAGLRVVHEPDYQAVERRDALGQRHRVSGRGRRGGEELDRTHTGDLAFSAPQRRGVCLARNSLMRTLAAASGAPCFHSGMNSHFGRSFETSSEIGYGCASSLPASTMHGVWQLETNARSTL